MAGYVENRGRVSVKLWHVQLPATARKKGEVKVPKPVAPQAALICSVRDGSVLAALCFEPRHFNDLNDSLPAFSKFKKSGSKTFGLTVLRRNTKNFAPGLFQSGWSVSSILRIANR